MISGKRIIIYCGHYGSGKTNIAVETAIALKQSYDKVLIADIDMVNPYFRTKDSEKLLSEKGIKLISSQFANTNLDIPALPQSMYATVDDKSYRAVIDVGGDDRGATALGRLKDKILKENDFEMLAVVNMYRPLTRNAEDAYVIMREIESACGIPCTGIVNNSNLGNQTLPSDVLNSVIFAEKLSQLSSVPLKMTTVRFELYEELKDKIENLYPLCGLNRRS